MLTIPISLPKNDEQLEKIVCLLKNGGASATMINMCEFFEQGEEREYQLSLLKKAIDTLKENNIRAGVWISTLGYGNKRDEKFLKLFPKTTPITAFFGRVGGAVCVLDKAMLEHNKKNVADFAKAGAEIIMLDDEFVLSVRPGFTCACELHLKEFERRTGKSLTGEEVSKFFTGVPNELRTAWMDMTGETLIDYCKELRASVDTVDPMIRMGLCASYTHYDLDGFNLRDALNILAGQNKPYLRLSGAAYWPKTNPRYPGLSMSGVVEFSRMQLGWLENEDIEITDENDPYPRRSDLVLPSEIEIFDKATMTQPKVNRFKYILDHGHDFDLADLAYYQKHTENLNDDEKITNFFRDKTPVGVRVFVNEQKIREVTLPEEYMGDKPLMAAYTNSYSCAILAKYGIPTVYSGGGDVFVCGEDARYLPKELVIGKLLADTVAAKILKERNMDCIELPVDSQSFDFTNPPDLSAVLNEAFNDLPLKASVLYPLVSKNECGDEMAVLLLNDKNETDEVNSKLLLDGEYEVLDTVNCKVTAKGNEITVDLVKALDYAALLLKRK